LGLFSATVALMVLLPELLLKKEGCDAREQQQSKQTGLLLNAAFFTSFYRTDYLSPARCCSPMQYEKSNLTGKAAKKCPLSND
jgi:hypothetical protein